LGCDTADDTKVRSGIWVLIEDVAAVAVTSATGSAKTVSIRLRAAVVTALAAETALGVVAIAAASAAQAAAWRR